jgi:4-amino-4-deoxy-L-arabinose transferase-like glycosyltransferase
MVPALTAVALAMLDRRADWLRPLLAPLPIIVTLFAILPWFVAITLRSDGAFWLGSVGADLLPKIVAGQEGKGAPPGTYLAALWLTFWPAPSLLLLSLPAIWRARREASTRFCLAWAIPIWLLYEAIPTKLIHYTLPAFPALALLAVAHLPGGLAAATRLLKGLAALAVLPGLLLGLVVTGYAVRSESWSAAGFAVAGLAGALVATGFALRSAIRSQAWALAAYVALSGAVLHAGLISAAARIPALWPTEQAMALATEIADAHGCSRPLLTGWGYTEPSMVWLGGRDSRLFPASSPAAEVIKPGACAVVIRARDEASAPLILIKGCRSARTVTGFAIGAGRTLTLDVLDCRGTQ